MAAGFAVDRLGGPWALFINASFLLMGLLVLTLPTITREPRVTQQAAANRWLGFGALFSLRYVPALTLLSLVFDLLGQPFGQGREVGTTSGVTLMAARRPRSLSSARSAPESL